MGEVAANDFSDAGDFIRDVFSTMLEACRMPALFVPAAIFSIAMDVAAVAVEWPVRDGKGEPLPFAFTVITLLILAKGWFGLTLCRIALAGLRGQATGVLNQWVSVQDALRIGFVTIALLFPIAIGLMLFVIPGLILLSRWSQVTLTLLDDQARWFDATDQSAGLTAGFRPAILLVLLITAIVTLAVEFLIHDRVLFAWLYRAAASTAGAGLAAALYYELTRRTPWD